MLRTLSTVVRGAGLAVLGLLAAGSPAVAPAAAQECAYPLIHGLEGYFICRDSGSYGGFAWQLSDPSGVNSGSADLVCEAPDLVTCFSPSSGVAGDRLMDIESAWSNPGFNGCPAPGGFGQRIALLVAE